ncbi:NAD-dependent succinate-semialdehyde dehydrogenase [Uliginosibacterium sp. H1]|uniref:NAD-dependent succinate-semialdehyde dehydrogenase n=1 Tax=Uliginosibacterium sp. H1 TaxID=3114757 RepID=UPI002E1809F5|nr:NAD-dependent succinate-semialdehyde dehydrogenase [Uliginosibacterium sp. H1]
MHARLSSLARPDLLKNAAFVGGEWLQREDSFVVSDPATDTQVARVANASEADASAAIAAAQAALPAWRDLPARERSAILRRWYELIIANRDDLATLMTAEQGKPLAEARGEVGYGAAFVEWFAEEARRIEGELIATPQRDRRLLVLRQPVGVCAAITPWNFPIAMLTRKAAPALAAGCTVIAKPAEQTPLCALALAVLAQEAGMPAGVLNVLPADAERSLAIGKVLCDSPVVRHLSFTGSTEVGRILMAQCAPTLKRLSLELGGHAPFIVFDDADIDAAVEGAIVSKYRNAGQTCVCANRFLVHAKVHDRFVDRLVQRVAGMKVGNGFDDGVELGPLIDDAGVAKVERHLADALQHGARCVTGGQRIGGRLFSPAVLTGVTPEMLVSREETFGPVAPVMKFHDDAEAIRLANASEFGLAAYFYSRDMARVWRVAEALEYGMVGINTGFISHEVAPFGGIKQSGFGREGSRHGIEEYLDMKYLCLAGLDAG